MYLEKERGLVFLKVEPGTRGAEQKGPQEGESQRPPGRLLRCSPTPGLSQLTLLPWRPPARGQGKRSRGGHPMAQRLYHGPPSALGSCTAAATGLFSCEERDGGVYLWVLGTVVTQDSGSFPLELLGGSCICASHKY